MNCSWKQIQDRLKNVLMDIGKKDSSILVVGMGRSGTTWGADIINYKNDHRILFEPFFPARVKEAKGFEYVQYLNPSCEDGELIGRARQILAGVPRNPWVDRDNQRVLYTRRIIKDIRCNLMLGWLKKVSPRIPIVMVVRHPLQVVHSWQKLGWGLEANGQRSDFEIITSQELLLSDFPIIERALREIDAQNPFERILFEWCVFHHTPLKQLRKGEAWILFYENLLIDPDAEIGALFRYLQKPVDIQQVLSRLGKDSSTNFRERNFRAERDSLLRGWRRHFSPEQIDKAQSLLTLFELDHLYNEEGLPSASREACFSSDKIEQRN
jgi:hypothetical protein